MDLGILQKQTDSQQFTNIPVFWNDSTQIPSSSLKNSFLGTLSLEKEKIFFHGDVPSAQLSFSSEVEKECLILLKQGYVGILELQCFSQKKWRGQLFFFYEMLNLGEMNLYLEESFWNEVFDLTNRVVMPMQNPDNPTAPQTLSLTKKMFSAPLPQNQEGFFFTMGHYPTRKEREEGKPMGEQPAFCFYGENYCFYVGFKEDCFSVFHIERYTDRKEKKSALSFYVGRGCLSFRQWEPRGQKRKYLASPQGKELLSQMKDPAYVQLWNAYAQVEGDLLLQEVRGVGYTKVNLSQPFTLTQGDENFFAYEVEHPKVLQKFPRNGTLLLSKVPPIYFESDLSWEFISGMLKKDKSDRQFSCEYYKKEGKIFLSMVEVRKILKTRGKRRKSQSHWEEGEAEQEEENLFCISLDVEGDKTRIQRRTMARQRIQDREGANPHMAQLLMGKAVAGQAPLATYHLSEEINETVFGGRMDPFQKKAVELSVNTPDFAIIQGPPGTGKTTVIQGIVEALKAQYPDLQGGEILITSSQHTAVDNVLDRIFIHGLPSVKFQSYHKEGGRQGIEEWSAQWVEAFSEKYPFLPENQLDKLYHRYVNYPNPQRGKEFFNFCGEVSKHPEILQLVRSMMDETEEKTEISYLQKCIEKFPTTPQGFSDGGREKAIRCMEELLGNPQGSRELRENRVARLTEKYPVLWEACHDVSAPPTSDFYDRCKELKRQLWKDTQPMPFYKKEGVNPQATLLYERVKEELEEKHPWTGDPTQKVILNQLLETMKGNPKEVEKAVATYSLVYGATLQHSMASPIAKAKQKQSALSFCRNSVALPEIRRNPFSRPSGSGVPIAFETVIVDEAALANPMDLMIALSQGRQRIILVGDHRQLPHIYDEERLEQLLEEGDFQEKEELKETMFQYLMKISQKLQQTDGIPRFITLGAQYRMHPLLGEFVSKHFYEKHQHKNGITEGFTSPQGEEMFAQPFHSSPVLWVHVPSMYGGWQRNEQKSLKRPCELFCILEKLVEYLNIWEREDCPPTTFGVTSFYRAQAEEMTQLIAHEVQNNPDLSPVVKEGLKQVSVGTVDGFQGKEVDVMFLSLLRSEEPMTKGTKKLFLSQKEHEGKLSALYQKYYGFMVKENRLCVALSRQKKLLVVVGNQDFYDTPLTEISASSEETTETTQEENQEENQEMNWGTVANSAVPALFSLSQHCQIEGGTEQWTSSVYF